MVQAFPFLRWRVAFACTTVAALAACETPPQTSDAPPLEPGVVSATQNGPTDAPAGTCWGKTVSPAIVERVSERVQVAPATINPDGTIGSAPVYRTEEKQVIVTPRQINWFETLCPDVLTVELISSLQRAMGVRGDYAGPITGQMDAGTRAAIQRLQRAQNGPDSPVLALETARNLGLIAVDRATLE